MTYPPAGPEVWTQVSKPPCGGPVTLALLPQPNEFATSSSTMNIAIRFMTQLPSADNLSRRDVEVRSRSVHDGLPS